MKPTTTLTAEELISESITHTTIANAAYTPELAASLMALSDDSVETADVVEYWGTDDYGNAWRVHLENDEFDPEAAMFYADLARVSRVTVGLRYKARNPGVYGQLRDTATGEVVYQTLVYPRGHEKEALMRCDIYAEQQGWTVAK